MPAVGGSIQSISIRGRLFAVASDADANKQLGGFTNEVGMNGNGTARKLMTRVPWSIDGLEIEVNAEQADAEFLQEVADLLDFVDITITYADGTTYEATGTVTDEIQSSSASATAAISLGGPGNLSQQ